MTSNTCFIYNHPSKHLRLLLWMVWLEPRFLGKLRPEQLTSNQMVSQQCISFAWRHRRPIYFELKCLWRPKKLHAPKFSGEEHRQIWKTVKVFQFLCEDKTKGSGASSAIDTFISKLLHVASIFEFLCQDFYLLNRCLVYEPRRERTGLRGFQLGPTQTESCTTHRRWLAAGKPGFR